MIEEIDSATYVKHYFEKVRACRALCNPSSPL